MTTFQLICAAVFVGAVVLTYGKDIYAKLKGVLPKLPALPVNPAPKPDTNGVAAATVRDLVTVAELRDRLDAENCKDGAEACSLLLKIIIDHKHPHAG
jgi:hypothetical protein